MELSEKRWEQDREDIAHGQQFRYVFDYDMPERTIEKANPFIVFVNGLFGCIFIREINKNQ